MGSEIAIGIVVFRPGPSLIERLRLFTSAGYVFYIFDNSPDTPSVRDAVKNNPNIKYFTTGKNAGLGIGISTLCAHAYYDSFRGMMFFDQDTGFSLPTIEFVDQFYRSRHTELSGYSAILFNARDADGVVSPAKRPLCDVTLAINSGSMFLLDNVKTLNWHDHSYFVDGVDYKFCLDSARHGLKIGECSWTPGFDHVTEQADLTYRLFGKEFRMRVYPFFRVRDTVASSIKLIGSAIFALQLRFAAKVMRLFIIYVVSQTLARGLDLVSERKQ